jgi:hypothetical protein
LFTTIFFKISAYQTKNSLFREQQSQCSRLQTEADTLHRNLAEMQGRLHDSQKHALSKTEAVVDVRQVLEQTKLEVHFHIGKS